jgi:predicted XRE-type DNA-binding protein
MLIQHYKKQEKDENIFQSVWEHEKDIQEQKVEIKRQLFSTLDLS